MIIYKITNKINGKIYVGQTVSELNIRFSNHCTSKSTMVITRAIKKNGRDNFTIEQIDSASSLKELDEKEIFWINALKATDNEIGYNVTSGGHTGYVVTPELKAYYSKSRKGKSIPAKYIAVEVINLETQERTTFHSYLAAAEFLGVHKTRISDSCNKKIGGRIVFKNKYTVVKAGEEIGEIISPMTKMVSICYEDGKEDVFESIIEASRKMNIDRDVIKHFALLEVKDKYGRSWKFKNIV